MTFQDIVDAVIAFTEAYEIYVTAAAILGLSFWGLRKLLKAGR